ncbi:MAG: BMP family ABC transporter substrate-binding protein [Candidatus Limisoma sp.]
MNIETSKIFTTIILSILLAASLLSCAGQDEPQLSEETPQIVFLFSPGGLGDMSYNDCILEGLQRFKKENPSVDVFMYSPDRFEESEKIFTDWVERPASNIPVLFVFASSDYDDLVTRELTDISLPPNKRVLVFESRKEFCEGVSSFQICMYGASYLAGVTAAEACGESDALVVLANPTDSPIALAADGFRDGFGKECPVEYLADDWTGYTSAAMAYRKMSDWATNYGFIFPVAGGSNSGIYRYSREFDRCPLLAGMDTDQSALSNRITGCVIKHIDRLIYEYLTLWLDSKELPATKVYDLESGYIDWVLAPTYESAYKDIVESHRQDAINKEKKII